MGSDVVARSLHVWYLRMVEDKSTRVCVSSNTFSYLRPRECVIQVVFELVILWQAQQIAVLFRKRTKEYTCTAQCQWEKRSGKTVKMRLLHWSTRSNLGSQTFLKKKTSTHLHV